MPPRFLKEESHALAAWAAGVLADASVTDFAAASSLVRRLGAHSRGGHAEFGFWVPELADMPDAQIYLELFTATETLDLGCAEQVATFDCKRLPVVLSGDFAWCAVTGLAVGNREQVGAFYWLLLETNGTRRVVHDHLAYSLPFGAFSPAELYDLDAVLAKRRDAAHFASLEMAPDPDGVARVTPPVNILQLHVPTATEAGTFAGLTEVFSELKDKLETRQSLSAAETILTAYDAVQLMPIEPIIEYEDEVPFFVPQGELQDGKVTVALRRPDMTNWGYDIVISGSSAINPALLQAGRLHEFLDFVELLHRFPDGGIKLILDVVYGHADNQALGVLSSPYIAGAGMYGQSINFRQPVVRAAMLEMQRRKSMYGVDGIRVDGAQDFKFWVAESGELLYDDDYLGLMNDIELNVAGVQYRPYMIFEDGRPWPRDDWELASSYREVTRLMPNVHQWGPLTFAHNTPFLFTFWLSKWWRIQEIAALGADWITGCANHDTLRRGTQVPLDSRINTFLGDSLPDILCRAYDNPAAKLFDYALMPGVPMDFLNASAQAPWSFIRNTDARYGVKVMSEEARFLHWAVDEASFQRQDSFVRLKKLGYTDLSMLRVFLKSLDNAVQMTDYDLYEVAKLLAQLEFGLAISEASLKETARAWMDDLHDYCKVPRYAARLNAEHATYMQHVRNFRHHRPWLAQNLSSNDYFDYRHPSDGSVLFYGLRNAPDGKEQLLFLANMEGKPVVVDPLALSVPGLAKDGWRLALATPGLKVRGVGQALPLADSEGAVFVRSSEE